MTVLEDYIDLYSFLFPYHVTFACVLFWELRIGKHGVPAKPQVESPSEVWNCGNILKQLWESENRQAAENNPGPFLEKRAQQNCKTRLAGGFRHFFFWRALCVFFWSASLSSMLLHWYLSILNKLCCQVTSPTKSSLYSLDLPQGCQWHSNRFRCGFPTTNVIILVVTIASWVGGYIQYIYI